MDLKSFFAAELDQHQVALSRVREQLAEPFVRLVEAAIKTVRQDGAILFFGNGGSAADAQHLATELAVRYQRDRKPIRGLALTTDSSALTAIGNDYGFDHLFSRQIEAVARPGDLAIGISTSGNSPNILAGLTMARSKGATAAGLAGRDGGQMVGLADPLLIVPATDTARIQEMHITLGHMLCASLEKELGLL